MVMTAVGSPLGDGEVRVVVVHRQAAGVGSMKR